MKIDEYVGKFVKCGEHYGMCDNVYGERLGLIWSDKESWTSHLAKVEDVVVLTDDKEIEQAKVSARNYLIRQHASLKARIARRLKMDDPKRLNELLDYIVGWLAKF